MSHYFENDNNLQSEIRKLKYTFRNHELTFETDSGVFSKTTIDFGTNVLLNSLPDMLEYKRILDVGCGYGIIGLSVAKAYPNSLIDMVDINERAIKLTKTNIEFNKIKNAKTYLDNLYEFIEKNDITYKYNCIISNPPIRAGKKIVHGIIIDGYKYLNDGGVIFVVIQKKQGAPSLKDKMEEVFSNVEVINKKNGYYILKSIKK